MIIICIFKLERNFVIHIHVYYYLNDYSNNLKALFLKNITLNALNVSYDPEIGMGGNENLDFDWSCKRYYYFLIITDINMKGILDVNEHGRLSSITLRHILK
jgi:hypothetical protein